MARKPGDSEARFLLQSSEMLRKANEELEARVQERTRELEVLTEELKRNTRSKTHFLAAASHDLLQPINAARLFTHSMGERSDEPEAIKHLANSIDQSLVTANELLRALLDISKLDSGGIQPEPVAFSLRDFVIGLVTELQPSAEDKGVSLICEIDDVTVFSDKQLLLSVMQNLVSNGLRYTASGGQVRVVTQAHCDEQITLRVIDTGVGIPEANLDEIFVEFFQIKKGSRRNARGLGLGLSIVQRISQLLGLDITVKSVEGEGSTFSIRLPTVQAAQVPKPASQPTVQPAYERLRGAKVLCLDNDESVLTAMRTLLEGWGCEVTSVATYKRGLAALDETEYQVVLADYRLDYLETGLDFLAAVQARNCLVRNNPKRGVLITAEQDKSLATVARESGFQFLAKPIEPASLKSLLLFILTED
jgi:C4-dicarboxylate-specific signal transduction histidine kinase/CheY-like chemotaxis protein